MKNFYELTYDQQQSAIEYYKFEIATSIAAGSIKFGDKHNKDELQDRVENLRKEMDRLHTPWFLNEKLLEDESISNAILRLAQNHAETTIYLEDELVLDISKLK